MGYRPGAVMALSDGATLAIGLGALAVLAIVTVVVAGAGRRRPVGVGALSRETVRADRGPLAAGVVGEASPRPLVGRDVERAAALQRTGTRRAEAEPAAPAAPARAPADADTLGVTRRQFFNRSIVGMVGLGLSGFASSTLAFLWPGRAAGFGAKVAVGAVDDILATIEAERAPYYYAAGRLFVAPYPTSALAEAGRVYSGGVLDGMARGVVALYQKCPHLGCRVPWCGTSQWFECPCHGSQYNRVGEKKGGPAPRGMDRFPVTIDGGQLVVDTGTVVQGPPIGTNTTGQEAEGPHCVRGGD